MMKGTTLKNGETLSTMVRYTEAGAGWGEIISWHDSGAGFDIHYDACNCPVCGQTGGLLLIWVDNPTPSECGCCEDGIFPHLLCEDCGALYQRGDDFAEYDPSKVAWSVVQSVTTGGSYPRKY